MSSAVQLLDDTITFLGNYDFQQPDSGKSLYPQNVSLIRQYSGHLRTSSNPNDNDGIFSLDSDDDDDASKYENMSEMVKQQLLQIGYAKLDDIAMENIASKCRLLIFGYVRLNYSGKQIMPTAITDLFCNFYPDIHLFCWNNKYLSLQSSEDEDTPNIYVVNKQHIVLSSYLETYLGNKNTEIVVLKKVRSGILELVVTYLVHHKGKKPEEIAKPIRSVKMERIVADKWDADYINKMNKKTIFQVILAANYMDVPSLIHLGCAKIATLIKGKSPEEIKNILADDSNDNNDNKQDDEQKTNTLETDNTDHNDQQNTTDQL